MNIFGYARVSSVDQNEDRQVLAMLDLKIPRNHIFVDKQTGANFNRPAYQKLIGRLQRGDVLYVKSIKRLGRNYEEILEQWRRLTKEMGVDMVVIDIPLLDTRLCKDLLGTFIADLVLQILSFEAQSEREDNKKRQREGIAAAHLRGVKFGRPVIEVPNDFARLVRLWEHGQLSLEEALVQTNLSRTTFFRRLRDYRQENESVEVPKGVLYET